MARKPSFTDLRHQLFEACKVLYVAERALFEARTRLDSAIVAHDKASKVRDSIARQLYKARRNLRRSVP